jgi:hypothetical protein
MNKWISKDEKQCLDLDKVGYWKYISLEDVKDYNRESHRVMETMTGGWCPIKDEISVLEVYMGGPGSLTFEGEEADEIYKKLLSRPEVI